MTNPILPNEYWTEEKINSFKEKIGNYFDEYLGSTNSSLQEEIYMIWQYVLILVILIVISLVIVKIRKEDFHIEINKLIQYLGGKDNIIDAQMNLSRLKVTVKDTTKYNI